MPKNSYWCDVQPPNSENLQVKTCENLFEKCKKPFKMLIESRFREHGWLMFRVHKAIIEEMAGNRLNQTSVLIQSS